MKKLLHILGYPCTRTRWILQFWQWGMFIVLTTSYSILIVSGGEGVLSHSQLVLLEIPVSYVGLVGILLSFPLLFPTRTYAWIFVSAIPLLYVSLVYFEVRELGVISNFTIRAIWYPASLPVLVLLSSWALAELGEGNEIPPVTK